MPVDLFSLDLEFILCLIAAALNRVMWKPLRRNVVGIVSWTYADGTVTQETEASRFLRDSEEAIHSLCVFLICEVGIEILHGLSWVYSHRIIYKGIAFVSMQHLQYESCVAAGIQW